MEAITFIARPKDGIIKIPKEYLESLNKEVQVVLLVAETKTTKKRSPEKRKIKSMSISTKGLKIDREKLNVR